MAVSRDWQLFDEWKRRMVPSDGTPGQVLTRTATGAGWATPSGGPGGGGSWGSITGTLADQTDLQTALDAALTEAEGDGLYDALGAASTAVAAHEAASDPHPQYMLVAEGDARYQGLDATLTALAALNSTAGLVEETGADTFTKRAIGVGATSSIPTRADGDARWQGLDATLTALAALDSTAGLLEQTGADTFTRRALGVGASTSVPTRADGDTRWAAASHTHPESDITSLVSDLAAKQSTSAKNAANGYPGLSASSLIDPAQLGTGSSITTKFLRGDSTWQTIAGGGDLLAANNLSDVANTATARSNLGAAPLASPTFTGTVNLPGSTFFAGGTASADSWPGFSTGTLLTTPQAGTIECDANCFYLTTDPGNRGVVPILHIIRADATRTFASNTSQQAIFNSPANGTLTLETGCYLFEALIAITSMSATSGNGKFSLLGAGTATLGSILWRAEGRDVAAEQTGGAGGESWHVIATQTATDIITAGTGTALCIAVQGTFEVTGAGTIIPSFAQTTAAAAVVSIGSYFKCHRIGSTSMTSVGQWT